MKNGRLGEIMTLAESTSGSDTFADAGTDAAGRGWVTWQSMRAGEGDIFCRYFDPGFGGWSKEIAVAEEKGGDWEPRLAFDDGDGAWVLYDSSRGNEFNLYLARVGLDGKVDTHKIAHSPNYEGRGSIAANSASDNSFFCGGTRKYRNLMAPLAGSRVSVLTDAGI